MSAKKSSISAAFILVTAFVTMLICTKSSPLYPLNDWVDANTYLTVGRGMLHGKVPYRDLYEQKGPLLYFLHAAAAFISDSSFAGVFVLETAACVAFLWEARYLMGLHGCGDKLWVLPMTALAVYSSEAFCHGDSAEELCLPLTLGAYIIGCKAVEGLPGRSGVRAFVLGVLAGAVIWVKLTFIGIFAAALAAVLVDCRRRHGELLRCVALSVLGAFAASVPVLLYFLINNAMDSLFSVYFYDNLFRYGGEDGGLLHNIADGWNFSRIFMTVPFCIICAGLPLAPLLRGRRLCAYYTAAVLLMFATVFCGHGSYQYYPLAMAVFVPEGVCLVLLAVKKLLRGRGAAVPAYMGAVLCAAALAADGVLSYKLSRNVYLMKYDRSDLPQYHFAELMDEEGSLLNYGFIDGGFYLAAGEVPEFRYFCRNNMSVPEMTAAQEHYVSSHMPEYIVTRSPERTPERQFEGYTLIASRGLSYYNKYFYYFLFRLNENSDRQSFSIE